MFVARGRTWTDEQLIAAVPVACCMSDVMRALGLRAAGGNPQTVRRHIARLGLDTSHFDAHAVRVRKLGREPVPLEEVLVVKSTYSRSNLKRRLYDEGLKERVCEQCGQGEEWRGRRMSLILDHVNGVHDDNRLENLQIVCPNCAATLDTHCGKQPRRPRLPRDCARCGTTFLPKEPGRRFCSSECGARGVPGERGGARPALRRVDRPPLDELRARIELDGYSAVARDLGVSDNAVRNWFRSAGEEPPRRYVRRRPGP